MHITYKQVLIIPEVYQLMCDEVAAGMSTLASVRANAFAIASQSEKQKQLLSDVCAWLTINSMKSEKVQWNLLMEQQVCDITLIYT
jgi:hypothetical protein